MRMWYHIHMELVTNSDSCKTGFMSESPWFTLEDLNLLELFLLFFFNFFLHSYTNLWSLILVLFVFQIMKSIELNDGNAKISVFFLSLCSMLVRYQEMSLLQKTKNSLNSSKIVILQGTLSNANQTLKIKQNFDQKSRRGIVFKRLL